MARAPAWVYIFMKSIAFLSFPIIPVPAIASKVSMKNPEAGSRSFGNDSMDF